MTASRRIRSRRSWSGAFIPLASARRGEGSAPPAAPRSTVRARRVAARAEHGRAVDAAVDEPQHPGVVTDVGERVGLVGVKPGDPALFERRFQPLVDRRKVDEYAFGRRLVVNGAYRRLRVAMGGLKLRNNGLE